MRSKATNARLVWPALKLTLLFMLLPYGSLNAYAASEDNINSVIHGLPGTPSSPGAPVHQNVAPQGNPRAGSENFVNQTIRKLTPHARPSDDLIALASSDTLVRIVRFYASIAAARPLGFKVGQVVPRSVQLAELPLEIGGGVLTARFAVIAGSDSIVVVEKATRKVHYRIDRTTLVVSVPQPNFLLIVDMKSGKPLLVDISAAQSWDVPFAYDSDEILPSGKLLLAEIGIVLRSPELQALKFVVSGHTDGIGSPAYNRDLSERRAIAVANYLVRYEAIQPFRVVGYGFGANRLKYPNAPRHPENRRVEVIAQVGALQ